MCYLLQHDDAAFVYQPGADAAAPNGNIGSPRRKRKRFARATNMNNVQFRRAFAHHADSQLSCCGACKRCNVEARGKTGYGGPSRALYRVHSDGSAAYTNCNVSRWRSQRERGAAAVGGDIETPEQRAVATTEHTHDAAERTNGRNDSIISAHAPWASQFVNADKRAEAQPRRKLLNTVVLRFRNEDEPVRRHANLPRRAELQRF